MKKKLIGFSYNKEEWKIVSTLGEGKYTFISSTVEKTLIFENDVVGILQINNDDTFFVTCKSNDDENLYVLYRIKITKYSPIIMKRIKFNDYQFITDDIILFNNRRFYSISNDGDIMDLCFLAGKNIEVFKQYKGKKSVLIVKEQISATDFVGVAIDPETFFPALTAYSSLRDQLIELTDTFTFDDLVSEDKHYADLVNSFFKSSSLDKTNFVLQNMFFTK